MLYFRIKNTKEKKTIGTKIKVTADFALFKRPEFQYDICNYDIITFSAARGVLEAIFWHPGMKWVVDKIYVLSEIRPVNLTSRKNYATLALRDVEYVIDAHFIMTDKASPSDNPGKFKDIINRRLERKDFFKNIYLGSKEYPADVELFHGTVDTPYKGKTINLGYMLYDYDYSANKTPIFFRATLKNGVLDLTKPPTRLLK